VAWYSVKKSTGITLPIIIVIVIVVVFVIIIVIVIIMETSSHPQIGAGSIFPYERLY
jgi:hypothetical protein